MYMQTYKTLFITEELKYLNQSYNLKNVISLIQIIYLISQLGCRIPQISLINTCRSANIRGVQVQREEQKYPYQYMTGTAIPESDDTESTHFWVHSALSFLDNSK